MVNEKSEKDRIKTWELVIQEVLVKVTDKDPKELRYIISARTINSALSKSCKFMRDRNLHEKYLIIGLTKLHTVDY